jgi:hypothetical protein
MCSISTGLRSGITSRRLIGFAYPSSNKLGVCTVRAKIRAVAGMLTSCYVVGFLLVTACAPAAAQDPASETGQSDVPQTPESEAGQTDVVPAPESEAAEPDLDSLMAPVALFPDPLLAAVLQASVVPLDIVMAARFLDDYAKDSTLTPDRNGIRPCAGCSPFRPCSRA